MTKRIVIHFEDETGNLIVSQFRKHAPKVGDVALLNGTPYAVTWRRDSSTSLDFGARPESEKREAV